MSERTSLFAFLRRWASGLFLGVPHDALTYVQGTLGLKPWSSRYGWWLSFARRSRSRRKPRQAMPDSGHHITPPRCPDGSWSKRRWRHCFLPMGHSGDHEYEVRLIEDERPPEHVFEDFRRLHGIEEQRG